MIVFLSATPTQSSLFEILLFRDVDRFIGAIFIEDEELIEIGAMEIGWVLRLSFPTKPVSWVKAHFDLFRLNRAPVDLFNRFDARFPRIVFPKFFDELFEMMRWRIF